MELLKKTNPFLRIIVTCCLISIAGSGIPINCAGLFFPQVATALNIGMGNLTFYLTILYIIAALFLPFAGKWLSGPHAKSILNAAVIINASAFASLGLAVNIWQFYAAGIAMGFSGAVLIFLAVPVLITNWFKTDVGVALGIPLSAGGVSGALFSPLIALCITNYGWRLTYGICGLVMLILTLPFTLTVSVKPDKQDEDSDKAKSEDAIAGLTLAASIRLPIFYIIFFFAGLLGLTSAFIVHIPACMEAIGQTSLVASSVLSAVTIGVTLGMIGIGWINDKLGASFATVVGIIVELSGIAMLFFADFISIAIMGGFCYGFGVATTLVAPPLIVRSLFGMRQYTQIYATVTVCLSICAGLGAAVFGFAADLAGNYYAALELGIGLLILALFCYCIVILNKQKITSLWSK